MFRLLPHTPSTVSQHPGPGSTLCYLVSLSPPCAPDLSVSVNSLACPLPGAAVLGSGAEAKTQSGITGLACRSRQKDHEIQGIHVLTTPKLVPELVPNVSAFSLCPSCALCWEALLVCSLPSLRSPVWVSPLLSLPPWEWVGGTHWRTALCQSCQSPAGSGSAQDVWMGHSGPGELMLPRRERLQHTRGCSEGIELSFSQTLIAHFIF